MEEKVLVESQQFDVKALKERITVFGICLLMFSGVFTMISMANVYDRTMQTIQMNVSTTFEEMTAQYGIALKEYEDDTLISTRYSSAEEYAIQKVRNYSDDKWDNMIKTATEEYYRHRLDKAETQAKMFKGAKKLYIEEFGILEFLGFENAARKHLKYGIIFFTLFFIAAKLIYAAFHEVSLIVTDKRVTGKTAWGKQVELPRNQLSAIAMGGIKGVAIATSSGKIKFSLIKNREEIFRIISDLLKEKQDSTPAVAAPVPAAPHSTDADELAKYKSLLGSGAITQEEYDAKKKQILGL